MSLKLPEKVKKRIEPFPKKPNSFSITSSEIKQKKEEDVLEKVTNEEKAKRRMSTMQKFRQSITMTYRFRKLVSGTRSRLKEGKYNLDLTYVKDNIVAMGLPSEGIESMYRNNINDVSEFLNNKHPGNYMIYNLAERTYNTKKFNCEIVDVTGWQDHSAPPLSVIFKLVDHMEEYLKKDEKNVACIHCKAGKGRTGTMICAYLLKKGEFDSVEDVMKFFVTKRSSKGKYKDGVTIPSQIRWLHYYLSVLKNNMKHDYSKTKRLKEVKIFNATKAMKKAYKSNNLVLYVYRMNADGWKVGRSIVKVIQREEKNKAIGEDDPLVYSLKDISVQGNVYIEGKIKKTKMFRCFFDPSFHQEDSEIQYKKKQTDIASKKKTISEDFRVDVSFSEGENVVSTKKVGDNVSKLSKAFQSNQFAEDSDGEDEDFKILSESVESVINKLDDSKQSYYK